MVHRNAGRDDRVESLLAELLQKLEEEPDFDVEGFLAGTDEEPALREHVRCLRGFGLIPGTEGATQEPLQDRYDLRDVIGHGGMGVVYRAWDRDLGRDVALKFARLDAGADAPPSREALQRFLDEARITGTLEHPNIVPVHDVGAGRDRLIYYTMKLVLGSTLLDVITGLHAGGAAKREVWSPIRRAGVIAQVCDALAFAHRREVVHRDVKPSNVMLGEFGEVLVMDWGLARRGKADGGHVQDIARIGDLPTGRMPTVAGRALGTPGYMAPEQHRGDLEETGPTTDVYNAGATLFHLFFGRPPGRPPVDVAAESPEWGFSVPREIRAICAKALAVRAEQRYESAETLSADLRCYQEDRAGSAWDDPAPVRLARRFRRRPAASTAVLSVVLLALLGGLAGQRIARERAERARLEVEKQDAAMRARLHALRQRVPTTFLSMRGSDRSQDQVAAELVSDYAAAYRQWGAPLDDPRADERLRVVFRDRPEMVRPLLDGIYDVALLFDNTGLIGIVHRLAREPDYRREGVDPSVLALHPFVLEQIDRLEPDVWRRAVWRAWRRMLDDLRHGRPAVDLGSRIGEKRLNEARQSRDRLEWIARLAYAMTPGDRAAHELALRLSEELADAYCGSFWGRFQVGSLWYREERFSDAMDHFAAAAAIWPDATAAQVNYGELLRQHGRLDEAQAVLRHAVHLDDSVAIAHHNLAHTYYLRREFERGAREAEAASRLAPLDADVRALHGALLWKDGGVAAGPSALAELRAARELTPGHPLLPWWEGEILVGLERWGEAVSVLQPGAGPGAPSPEVFLLLATAREALGDEAGAREALEAGLEAFQDDEELTQRLAEFATSD